MSEQQTAIEQLVNTIETMIDSKISISQGNNHQANYNNLYQARADIKEYLAILFNVEIK